MNLEIVKLFSIKDLSTAVFHSTFNIFIWKNTVKPLYLPSEGHDFSLLIQKFWHLPTRRLHFYKVAGIILSRSKQKYVYFYFSIKINWSGLTGKKKKKKHIQTQQAVLLDQKNKCVIHKVFH